MKVIAMFHFCISFKNKTFSSFNLNTWFTPNKKGAQ